MVAVVFEGDTDLPVVRKLARDARLTITLELDCSGKSQLDLDLDGFNSAAKGSPWFVLRDLDEDADCAPTFLAGLGFEPSRFCCFRLAVRELESWLLADSVGIARFLEIPESLVPLDPDSEPDPTRTLVRLAQRSPRSSVRRAMAPAPGSRSVVGPLYETWIIEFGSRHWNLHRAAKRSESLRKARRALRNLGKEWRNHLRGEA